MAHQRRILAGILFSILFAAAPRVLDAQTDQTKKALTNQDVIGLCQAGLSPEVVTTKIKSTATNFDTSPEALKHLKQEGVPDSVILAMLQPVPSEPTVDDILNKYIQALGGESAIRKITTRETKGTFLLGGKPGTFESFAKAPNMMVANLQMSDNEAWKVSEGYDGATAWLSTPQTGTRVKTSEELAITARYSEFYAPLRFKELYPKMTLLGKERVENADCYVIQMDPEDGTMRRAYFDSKSGLLLRSDVEFDSPQGRKGYTWYYEDYREVDGTKIPFVRRQPNPDQIITVTEIRQNLPLDDRIFAKPEGGYSAAATIPPNTIKALAYRVVPQQRTTYYQSGGSAYTSCYGQGQFQNFGSYGNINLNTNCNTSYTEPTQIPITWQFADVYEVVQGPTQTYLIGCRANWRWSNCMPLIVGEIFQVKVEGGKMVVTATKNGKKEIHTKFNILQVTPNS